MNIVKQLRWMWVIYLYEWWQKHGDSIPVLGPTKQEMAVTIRLYDLEELLAARL
jgi:hypothetical protein